MRLKELRKKKNVTQQEVAEHLFITQHGYSNYEINKTEPNIETLCKLADYYNVTLDYLVGRNFVSDIGYLSEQQREAVSLMQKLDEQSLSRVIAYMSGIIDNK